MESRRATRPKRLGSESRRGSSALPLLVMVLVLAPQVLAFASEGLVEIEFIAPEPQRKNGKFDDLIPLVTTSGWVLGLKLETRAPVGIGQATEIAPYPTGRTAFLVFDDPDGCFSPACDVFGPLACGLMDAQACPAPDETMVEFTPDSDVAGVPDPARGNPDVQALQAQPAPVLHVFGPAGLGEPGSNSLAVKLGPQRTNEDALDGYGPGPDDDLPGLVVLANSGFALEYDDNDVDQDGDTSEVSGARNLAGLFDTVGYSLSARDGGVNLFAQTRIPEGLLAAFVLVDEGLAPDGCDGDSILVRVNGGAPFPLGSGVIPDGFAVPFDPVVTMRAFLVEGIAPSRLDDLDGDGTIDSRDAELAGYRLYSNEAVLEVEQYYQHTQDFLAPFRFDLDGDGFAACNPIEAPGGPGTVTPTPR